MKEFIEKAIEGGYPFGLRENIKEYNGAPSGVSNIHKLFLDPKAWEAVGKVEGWGQQVGLNPQWTYEQLDFVKHLQQGKSIEEALLEVTQ